MSEPKLVIRQQKTLLWYSVYGSVMLVALILSYISGRYFAVSEQEKALERVVFLQQELIKFQTAYQQVNEDLVMQTQTAKVDNQSNQELVDSVKNLQKTQRKLESELSFYRKIMAPERDKDGLTIGEFIVTKENSNKKPQFKLVLTQAGKQDQFLKGKVTLKLKGKLQGVDKIYSFSELGTFKDKHFQFQFRYFQNIEGELSLPDGFIAEQVVIQAKTRGLRKNQTTQKQINWNR